MSIEVKDKHLANLSEDQKKYLDDELLGGYVVKVGTYLGATRVDYGQNEIKYYYQGNRIQKDQAKAAQGYDAWELLDTEGKRNYYSTLKRALSKCKE